MRSTLILARASGSPRSSCWRFSSRARLRYVNRACRAKVCPSQTGQGHGRLVDELPVPLGAVPASDQDGVWVERAAWRITDKAGTGTPC